MLKTNFVKTGLVAAAMASPLALYNKREIKMTKSFTKFLIGAAASMLLASTASANLIVNPGFEDPSVLPGVEYFGAPGWTDFGGTTFTIGAPVFGPAGPHDGTQGMKMFAFGGLFQQFAASPGQIWDGGVWALNDTADLMAGGQVAAVNLEWIAADGVTSLGAVFGPRITASTTVNDWNFMTVSGEAIAGTAFTRLVLITGDFLPGGFGGAPRFDDAFLVERAAPVPVPASVWLFGSALGLLGWMRRKS